MRPTVVTMLAGLNVFFGAVGILMAPISLLSVLSAVPASGRPDPVGTVNPQTISFFMLFASYCASVLLFASGIGLLKMKSWSWWMAVGCAVYSLIQFFVSRIFLLLMSIGAAAHRESYLAALLAGSVLLCLPSVIHPMVALLILLPDSVRRAFAEAGLSDSPGEAKADSSPVVAHSPFVPGQSSPGGWILRGPSMPPYRRNSARGLDAAWTWAILLAPTTFALLLLLTVLTFATFTMADVPNVLMGVLALLAGSLMLAGAMFEWRWFFASRGARGLRYWAGDAGARWFYVAVSGILLLLGICMVGFAAMPSMAGKIAFLRMLADTQAEPVVTSAPGRFPGQRSILLGGNGGDPFERFDPDNQAMLGVRYELGEWGGQQVIAKIEPVFEGDGADERVVIAEAGYRVGGMQVDSGQFVHAVRFRFVPIAAQGEPAKPVYESDWIGSPRNPDSARRVDGEGRLVVGLFGRQGIITDAIGLLYAPTDD